MLNSTQFIQYLMSMSSLIRQYTGQVIVVKYGGAAMQDESLKRIVIDDILFLHLLGIKVIVVHGGGPIINQWLYKCNIQPVFENGVRITDQKTMEIVQMVLEGKVNKNLVSMLNLFGNYAIGLSGRDLNLIHPIPLSTNSNDFVGTVSKVDPKILNSLLNDGYIPVIASIASDSTGRTYNINADTVAGALAKALKAKKLIFLTDTFGIMRDIAKPDTLLKTLTIPEVLDLKKNNIISGGMIPKVDCSIDVLHSNVQAVHIINGCLPHALLQEVLTSERVGSMLTL
uniref:acetylglutamate kinase n=1 Tax=Hypnea brasiliensis TaxID=1866962 RepID=UPI0023F4B689|nr:acetylglutamate kinase [Hypnea brasiliensis]WCH55403.1 acetylglutamate kinase [Hypnea brasiliensis]WDY84806.1 acetylglutamate kinase [Hypnea brasiliensis]